MGLNKIKSNLGKKLSTSKKSSASKPAAKPQAKPSTSKSGGASAQQTGPNRLTTQALDTSPSSSGSNKKASKQVVGRQSQAASELLGSKNQSKEESSAPEVKQPGPQIFRSPPREETIDTEALRQEQILVFNPHDDEFNLEEVERIRERSETDSRTDFPETKHIVTEAPTSEFEEVPGVTNGDTLYVPKPPSVRVNADDALLGS